MSLFLAAALAAAIQTDGRIDAEEWAGAATRDLGEGVTLLVLNRPDGLYLATRSAARGPHYTDLYVAGADAEALNLHASMQTGERRLPAAGWSDAEPAFAWGRQAGWNANTVAERPQASAAASLAEQLQPYDGQEFRIAHERLPVQARWRVEVRDFEGKKPDLAWPPGSTRTDRSSWAPLPG